MKWVWYVIYSLMLSFSAYSQEADRFFIQHLDNRNGLSNSAVNYLFQDQDNILWTGTWDGLNMFDGTNFHVFNYGSKSIDNNVIQYITQDKQRNVWVATIEGVSRYNKSDGRFSNYFYTHSRKSKVSEEEFKLAVDSGGTVFCWTKVYGLTRYEHNTDTFSICQFPYAKTTLSKISFDSNDRLWLLKDNGELTVHHKDFTIIKKFTAPAAIVNFFITNNQFYYCTANNQLFQIDLASYKEKLVLQLPHSLRAISYYKDHYVLAWLQGGLWVYDTSFVAAPFLSKEVMRMQDMKITSFALGSEQILWCGTDGNGLIKIYPKTKSFETVYTSDAGQLSNKSVRAFCEENGNLWIGTKGSGIIRFQDFNRKRATAEKENFSYPRQLDNNSVFVLKKGTDNFIYIGTDAKGIGVYDIEKAKFYKWTDINQFDSCCNFGSVYAVLQDTDGTLWLGTSGYGLIHLEIYRASDGKLTVKYLDQFTFKDNNEGPANDIIYALAEGDANYIWVACRYGGLSLLDKRTKRFRTFKAFTYDGSLSHNDVLSLYKDSKNRLWVGTSYGLNQLEAGGILKNQPVFRKLTTANGLPNNTIHAITEDNTGHIWASTNKGLARINADDLEVSHYQEADGLQSNEFSDGAGWKDANGYLFFGGTYGFNYFLPQKISANMLTPNLLVTNLQMGDKTLSDDRFLVVHPGQDIAPDYTVSRKGDFFELQIKAISFLNADKCEYAYFLEGYDKAAHYSGTFGKIIYNNLPPGNYSLKVRWSNGEGVWTNDATLFTLQVKQYIWLTAPALLFYALLLLLGAYIIYRYRKNRIAIKHQLEIEHAMRTKEEELHQEQLGFFTNITHELQTPLTLIMGSTERFMENNTDHTQKKPYFLSLIHEQASRLTYLVQQLLEFRKAEAGFLDNHYRVVDISTLLTNLANLFIPLCAQQKKEFEKNIAPDILQWIDKDKLEKVMFNLLSNAFKHSGKDDQIVLTVQENKTENQLEIIVANSGVELSPEQLEKLFDKFYMTGFSGGEKFGAGIGLAFTRQLVLLMKGSISVDSEDNWIRFRVIIPFPAEQGIISSANDGPAISRPSYLYQAMTSSYAPLTASENNKQAIVESLQQQNQQSILIVDDESSIRYLLKDIFKEQYTIYEAENGREALEFLKTTHPDLILSDVMMPDIDGLELCNAVKNAPSTCHIPFVLLSARVNQEQQTEGYEVGADAYIPKPFHTQHLKIRVSKLLEYRKRLIELVKNEGLIDFNLEPELVDVDKKFLSSLVELIEEHLDETEFNAAALEKELNMSRMQLYRKLKTLTQMTPAEFIKHIRLKHAAHLLISTQLTVSEIFYRTGFNNQSYFFREFKKMYQYAPNEYRSQ